MACTPTDFKLRFPEFENETDERIQLFMDDSKATINSTCPNADLMSCYLTAHLLTVANLTLSGETGEVKPISSESVGDVSVSYGGTSKTSSEDDFYSTAYGQRYLTLKANCIGRPIIA